METPAPPASSPIPPPQATPAPGGPQPGAGGSPPQGGGQPDPGGAVRNRCPACDGWLRTIPDPLRCSSCDTEYHKKCSGLTQQGLKRWKQTRSWQCPPCDKRRDQVPTNQPGASATSDGPGVWCKKSLLMCQWNADGIGTAMGDLKELSKAYPNLGVIMVQETKLRPTDPDPKLLGFTI